MLIKEFESSDYSFSCDSDTGNILLYDKSQTYPVLIKDYDAELFRRHIELINSEPDTNTVEKTERSIQIFLHFTQNPVPIPNFVE